MLCLTDSCCIATITELYRVHQTSVPWAPSSTDQATLAACAQAPAGTPADVGAQADQQQQQQQQKAASDTDTDDEMAGQ